ncbi:MAG: TetR/AcrR family transcriptional regulator [Syntrophomonadaceae bacterium]|jgi:AcrR family transcriptional regulator
MRRKDDKKLENIKQAVMKMILQEGFQGASIAKIAKEAGISPATVYIYYNSKDDMMRDIYKEYGEKFYTYLLTKVDRNMSGEQLIDALIKACYTYITEFGEAFHFIDQFSACPALVQNCDEIEGCTKIAQMFEELKQRKVIKDIDNNIIRAIIFAPVKSVVVGDCFKKDSAQDMLEELIKVIKDALLL